MYGLSPNRISSLLFTQVPYDVTLVILKYTDDATCCRLSAVSKDTRAYIHETADYVMGGANDPRYISPITTNPMVKMTISLCPRLLQKWGCLCTTTEREVMFLDAIRRNDINFVKHIASLGVDLDTRNVLAPIKPGQNPNRIHPVHEATMNDNHVILETLFDHGAHYNPVIDTGKWFMNGYEDLIRYVPETALAPRTPVLIIRNHMKNRDFAPFFQYNWRYNRRLYGWFCEALKDVEGKVVETYYGANCSEEECGKWCRNILMCNGRMLCSSCATTVEIPAIDSGHLWIETVDYFDDDDTVQYPNDNESIGTWDENSDDESIGSWHEDEFTEYYPDPDEVHGDEYEEATI